MKKYLLILTLVSLLQGCWITERGEKIGNIVKIGKQGLLIKTNEAELIRGGLNNGNGSFGRPFDFTIEDDQKREVAEKAFDEQKPVRIKYHKELVTLFRTETGDNSFLDEIEIID